MKTLLIAATALVAVASVVQARPIYVSIEPVRSEHISVADINLGSEAGRATVHRRIRAAAAQVCSTDGDRSVAELQKVHTCFWNALEDGDRQLADLIESQSNPVLAVTRITTHGR